MATGTKCVKALPDVLKLKKIMILFFATRRHYILSHSHIKLPKENLPEFS